MSPRRLGPVSYGKRSVNRAGGVFVERLHAAATGGQRVGQQQAEVLEAVEIIDWWRSD